MTDYNLPVSPVLKSIDIDFIVQCEGFKLDGYIPFGKKRASFGKSGITIGAGVDLAYITEATLEKADELCPGIFHKLRRHLGFTGREAMNFLSNSPLRISYKEAIAITGIKYETIHNKLAAFYERDAKCELHTLSTAMHTIIFSVAVQYGEGLYKATPKFWRAAIKQDKEAMIAELRDFGDDFPTRRNKEADYLENNG